MPKAKVTAAEVKLALRARHRQPQDGAWSIIEEAGCGRNTRGTGGIDVLAIAAWKTAKVAGAVNCGDKTHNTDFPVICYEVKVDRSDFRYELEGRAYQPAKGRRGPRYGHGPWPEKAQYALDHSHYFFFATPKGLLKPEEIERFGPADDRGLWIPPTVGLIEVGEGGRCYVARPAAIQTRKGFVKPKPFNRGEIGEIVRHALDPASVRKARAEAASATRLLSEVRGTLSEALLENRELLSQLDDLQGTVRALKSLVSQ